MTDKEQAKIRPLDKQEAHTCDDSTTMHQVAHEHAMRVILPHICFVASVIIGFVLYLLLILLLG